MIKTALKILLLLALVAYSVVALLWSRARAEEKRCSSVYVIVTDSTSSRFVTPAEVVRDLGNMYADAPGTPVVDLDTYAIVQRLDSIDKIENAEAVTYTDGSLEISVTPMRPVARIFSDNQPSFYINRQGKRIAATARYHVDVPVISLIGNRAPEPMQMLPLVSYLSEHPQWDSLITHIKATSPTDIILVPMFHGHVLNLGSVDDLQSKFNRIETAYSKIMPVKGWDFYDTISVKWKGQIVATRRTKKLEATINPAYYEAEREEPDIGTMMAGDSVNSKQNPIKQP